MRFVIKCCSVVALVLLVIVALGPAGWQPRTGLGWEIEHFVGYFAFTLMVCFAWPRPFAVGVALMAVAVLLEGLQALTPDRSSNVLAALYGAGGVLAAAVLAEFFIRAFADKTAKVSWRNQMIAELRSAVTALRGLRTVVAGGNIDLCRVRGSLNTEGVKIQKAATQRKW